MDRTDDDPAASDCTAAPNDCSLRGAVAAANDAAPSASHISVPAGTYVLSQTVECAYEVVCGENPCPRSQEIIALCIDAPVTIQGAGIEATILDGNLSTPLALISAGADVALSDLTVTHGRHETVLVTQQQVGGAVINHGTLRVTDAVLHANQAVVGGGAIYNAGLLTVTRSAITGNSGLDVFGSNGGGIFADTGSSTTIVDSTIASNDTSANGGGIYVRQGSLAVRGSTLSGNATSFTDGGGLYLTTGSTAVLENSTISGNHAGREGGGIRVESQAQARLRSVTIADNAAAEFSIATGGGVSVAGFGTLKLRNTLIADNEVVTAGSAWPDLGCANGSTATSEGYNLIGNPTGCTLAGNTTGDLDGDPGLGPLGGNGGPTETQALGAGSPAIDAGDPSGCTDDAGGVLPLDQRGSTRSADGNADGATRCDIGAFELSTGGASLLRIHPTEGGDAGSVLAVLRGGGFETGAIAKLVRVGQADVLGTDTIVSGNGTVATTRFDLTGRSLGAWDVVVENPGSESVTLPAAFTIATSRAPDLWVEVIGADAIRARRPTRYLLRYGNRGNTDAFAVPLLFGYSDFLTTAPRFPIAPPPQQPGRITTLEWGRYQREVLDTGEEPAYRSLPLLLPVVPAGSSAALGIVLTAPRDGTGAGFSLRLEIAKPLFIDAPEPEAVARLVRGAREKSARLFSYPLPTWVDDEIASYASDQLDRIVFDGVADYLASGGTEPGTYSLSQLAYDLAAYGLVAAQTEPPAMSSKENLGTSLATETVAADGLACVCGQGPRGAVCCPGCFCPPDDGKDVPEPPKPCFADLDNLGKDGCKRPETPNECREIGFEVIHGQDASGKSTSICTSDRKCLFSNPVGGNPCIKFPLRSVASHDPNDKTGPAGGGEDHFVPEGLPLAYTVRFENQPMATAPAAEVVITDLLDSSRLDLGTLVLGPVGFGETVFVPPPGESSFTTDIDLRPEKDLVVRVTARLEEGTDVLRWRLTSLDPDTMEPPEDALAGFLPPNLAPPEGDGFVSFTILPRPELTSGTMISNGAEIVFDENDPIFTPVWSNVIDRDAPTSEVVSVAPAGVCSQDLSVSWSGSDATSFVQGFAVDVAEDGGSLEPWTATGATSGLFHGKWGTSYEFRTTATDAAGNVEAEPQTVTAAVAVPDCGPFDLAVTKVTAPRTVKLSDRRPVRNVLVRVAIQNRSLQAQTIADAETLAELVSLEVAPLGAGCVAAPAVLRTGKPQKPLPIVLKPKRTASVVFDVLVDCAVDPAAGPGHEDFELVATVDQNALGGVDAHPADDVCPRPGTKPSPKDPFPDGTIAEKGCGRAIDGLLGGPVTIDVLR